VLDRAGEPFSSLPLLGGDDQGAGGREGPVELLAEVQEVRAEDTRGLLAPGELEPGVAGQVGGHAEDLWPPGQVEVGRGGREDVEDNVAGVGDGQACRGQCGTRRGQVIFSRDGAHHGHTTFSMGEDHHGHPTFSMDEAHHGHPTFSMDEAHHDQPWMEPTTITQPSPWMEPTMVT